MKSQMEHEKEGMSGDNQMQQIEAEFEQNKQSVIEMLINNCMAVDTSIPRVVCGRFE